MDRMSNGAHALVIERLASDDIVAVAQCIAIDAEAFPYASATFGLRDSAARAWVARDERAEPQGPVLGFIAGHVRRGVLHLEGLAVEVGLRRRGIGRALVRKAVAHARAKQLLAVALHVSVANRAAMSLYGAEGFAAERRLRRFYPAAAFDGEADAYEMVLRCAR
jgi:ribosomal protein S18 acetylase RimI-like enzyme